MVKDALGHKFHWAVADYLQRAARHIASATDVKQAYQVGARAVEFALAGHNAVMPTIERISDVPYRYRIGMAPLAKVANVEKFMPRDFVTKDGFGITDKCKRYLSPLIAGIVKDKLAYKVHWAVADYLQRAARHLASKTDLDHSYAVGKAAVLMALAGRNAVMPAITRVSDRPYKWKITEAPLTRVANVEKMLPRDFITKDGFGITDKARRYLAPLIRGEAPPPYKDGLPQYVRLKNVAVPKKLKSEFKV
jgi:6-phosphofructokinase